MSPVVPKHDSALPHAFDLTRAQWEGWCVDQGAKAFVGGQILHWIFVRGERDPRAFSNVPAALRERLAEVFRWELARVDTALPSSDGSEKILWRTHEGLFAECVIMPSENRVTLCVSSQVGCRMACTFCQTGRMGLTRDLTSGEIVGQILLANDRLATQAAARGEQSRKVTNVVFMGMGEPLDNYDAVVEACRKMVDEKLLGLSKHRVTVSTSGLVPAIERLGHDVPVSLAISLHSCDDTQRSEMMPVNRKYPLAVLKEALLRYPVSTRHGITFEYVMIKDKNDSIAHAKKLVKFVHGLKAKVNLIPMNAHPGTTMEAAEAERLRAFQCYLADRSIPAPVRYSRGQDVSAACGQLAAKREGEIGMAPRLVAIARRKEYLQAKGAREAGTP